MSFATTTDLPVLSRLLDQALDLDPETCQRWLETLPPDASHLCPELQAMLREHWSGSHTGYLEELPTARARGSHRAGDQVGPYRLLRLLGQGGASRVWQAAHVEWPQADDVALKLPHGCGSVRALRQEGQLLDDLRHPGIVEVVDAGSVQEAPYLALQLVCGQPLDAWHRQSVSGLRGRLLALHQLANAVAYLHGHGIVHRDLKPANVLVTAGGMVRLIDFGIAARFDASEPPNEALTRSFTLGYAAPEQVEGAPAAPSADIFSLGVLLCEALVGPATLMEARSCVRPVGAGKPGCVRAMAERLLSAVEASNSSRELQALARCALEPAPARRLPSASCFARALKLAASLLPASPWTKNAQ
jgi:eukaryotic-like serine/threonine-protein kinase